MTTLMRYGVEIVQGTVLEAIAWLNAHQELEAVSLLREGCTTIIVHRRREIDAIAIRGDPPQIVLAMGSADPHDGLEPGSSEEHPRLKSPAP